MSKPINKTKKNTDWIAWLGLFVNGLLFLITYSTLEQTKRAVDISEKALNDSKIKDSLNNIQSSIDYNNREKKYQYEKSRDSLTNMIAYESLNQQIKTLKQIQNQFEIENEPFLAIKDFKDVDSEDAPAAMYLDIGRPFETSIAIENIGKYPCKIINGRFIGTIEPEKFSTLKYGGRNITTTNQYILNEKYIVQKFKSFEPVTQAEYDRLMEKKGFYYITGYIEYINMATKKIKTFKFQIRLSPIFVTKYIISENINGKIFK